MREGWKGETNQKERNTEELKAERIKSHREMELQHIVRTALS